MMQRTNREATAWRVILGATLAMTAAIVVPACRKSNLADQDQIGAAVGEVMASIDESTKGSGATAYRPSFPVLRMPDEFRGPRWRAAFDWVAPVAYAATCVQSLFTTCSAGVRARTFDQCSVGAATLNGAVMLTFSDTAACAIADAGQSVTRTADFTLAGPYGGTLAVSAPDGGQTLTRTAGGFSYTVGGMRRVLTGPDGHTLFDISTRTTVAIGITGSSRADLVIASGALEISHNLAKYQVTLAPQNLTWASTCNCAVAGQLVGTLAGGGKLDGKSATVVLTGCGQADVSIDGETESVTLDRCASL
jgi:hypothetical protein